FVPIPYCRIEILFKIRDGSNCKGRRLIYKKTIKMKKHIKSVLFVMITSLLTVSCMDSYLGIEQVQIDGTEPNKVTLKEVVSKSGGLEIHFALPAGNPNISEVVASYTSKSGEHREFKVSRYN